MHKAEYIQAKLYRYLSIESAYVYNRGYVDYSNNSCCVSLNAYVIHSYF